jgi:hypothetical protein
MVTFTLANDREQKIDAFDLPEDGKCCWVGLYCYDEEKETLYFFGDKEYVLGDLSWKIVDDHCESDYVYTIVKKIEIV